MRQVRLWVVVFALAVGGIFAVVNCGSDGGGGITGTLTRANTLIDGEAPAVGSTGVISITSLQYASITIGGNISMSEAGGDSFTQNWTAYDAAFTRGDNSITATITSPAGVTGTVSVNLATQTISVDGAASDGTTFVITTVSIPGIADWVVRISGGIPSGTPTATPSTTATPTATPTPEVIPVISTFNAEPDTVNEDQETSVTWTWTYSTAGVPTPSCAITYPTSQTLADPIVSGTAVSINIPSERVYTLTCTNTAGSDTAAKIISAEAP